MKIFSYSIQLTFLLFLTAGTPLLAYAQNDDNLILELDSGTKKNDSYRESQDRAIQYIQKLESHLEFLGNGNSRGVPKMDDKILHYLTGAYLYCMKKQGACPVLLYTILETDIINSKISRKAECPNMLNFWKVWIKNNFEKRHRYMIATGFVKRLSDFNENTKPKLIRCTATVQEEIAEQGSTVEFFQKRYTDDPKEIRKNIQSVLAFLKKLKESVSNVFVEVGAV